MNVRINVTIPAETVEKLKKVVAKRGISRFLTDAVEEKITKIEREKALKELLAMPPTFTHIKDSRKWVRDLRRRDLKRMKRLGLA